MGAPQGEQLNAPGSYTDVTGSITLGSSRTPNTDFTTLVLITAGDSGDASSGDFIEVLVDGTRRDLRGYNTGQVGDDAMNCVIVPPGSSYTINSGDSDGDIDEVHEVTLRT